jgi:hypothetical protein
MGPARSSARLSSRASWSRTPRRPRVTLRGRPPSTVRQHQGRAHAGQLDHARPLPAPRALPRRALPGLPGAPDRRRGPPLFRDHAGHRGWRGRPAAGRGQPDGQRARHRRGPRVRAGPLDGLRAPRPHPGDASAGRAPPHHADRCAPKPRAGRGDGTVRPATRPLGALPGGFAMGQDRLCRRQARGVLRPRPDTGLRRPARGVRLARRGSGAPGRFQRDGVAGRAPVRASRAAGGH